MASLFRFHAIPTSFEIKIVIIKIKPGRFNMSLLESTDRTVSREERCRKDLHS